MSFFAHFTMHEGYQFRLDTRIYIRDSDDPRAEDTCIAAIIGKNPGSANPTELNRLSRLSLDGDRLLPYVRNRFIAAYKTSGSRIPQGAYIRVWNLLYICNPKLNDAITTFNNIQRPLLCETESNMPPIVWFAWGPPNPSLTQFTARFLERTVENPFYYDNATQKVVAQNPMLTSRVRHTQGLPAAPVEKHLANLIG